MKKINEELKVWFDKELSVFVFISDKGEHEVHSSEVDGLVKYMLRKKDKPKPTEFLKYKMWNAGFAAISWEVGYEKFKDIEPRMQDLCDAFVAKYGEPEIIEYPDGYYLKTLRKEWLKFVGL